MAGEFLVLTHVGTDDAGDRAGGEQDTEAAAVHAAVVGDDPQPARALCVEGADEDIGDAAEAEAADGQ
ncbi:hypothetical protein GCM10017771_89910 [Streptomyces capitiformicae]|uniref:Uncharacterized protein n=1 Tax=Streptomyces capitiformicae TaxID=2014920 RepID=A0A918ZSJ8_9ACTN|nr:hypothetical protein GCM10017771_89910 [Streptomyces capitiformicae]